MDSRACSGSSKAVTRGPSSTPSRCSRIGTLERRALAPSFNLAPSSCRRSNESKWGGGALLPWPTPVRPRRQRQAQYARAAIEGARADDGRGRPRHAPASEATTALYWICVAAAGAAAEQHRAAAAAGDGPNHDTSNTHAPTAGERDARTRVGPARAGGTSALSHAIGGRCGRCWCCGAPPCWRSTGGGGRGGHRRSALLAWGSTAIVPICFDCDAHRTYQPHSPTPTPFTHVPTQTTTSNHRPQPNNHGRPDQAAALEAPRAPRQVPRAGGA